MTKLRAADDDEMPEEFDLSKSIPNPWFVTVHGPEYVRIIDRDLADVFPDNESMNIALRTIAEAAGRTSAREVSVKTTAASKPTRRKARS